MANQGGNMKKASFCFLIIILWQLSNFVLGAIPASERAALIALYKSTNGDSWNDNSGWKTPPLHTDGFAMPGTEEYWHGVVLSGDNVSRIFLEDNYLNGSIPPELGNLSNLEELWLYDNQLSGSIPPQSGNLSNLKNFFLMKNQLSGSIPPQLGNLSNLEALGLYSNRLSGSIPPELGNLSNLRNLNLYSNQLSGSIPPQLGNLNNLEYLYLYNNQLSGSIPPELGNLSDLLYFFLGHNRLSGNIPPELGNISRVNYLLLDHNQLSGSIPPQLANIDCLRYLYLDHNQLSGTIPSQLSNSRSLMWLFLDHNQLSGSIPPELGNIGSLNYLGLDHNQLSGKIPSNFTNLTNLSYLDVGYNCLFAADSTFISWLNSHDPDWEATQCLEKAPPFGYFETPIHNSTVCSSVAVTGWALDDYGMDSVKIYCEYENTRLFIGDAIFVEGARPDVEAAYPGYPENNKAGWGYMLLTNFLPNGGNGTYVLHAIAADRYGKTTTLGTKTIIVDNAHAVKPFGAIDTPVQGGTASGSGFLNWGWALTPAPNKIPFDGSTIDVWINGVNIGHPTYNIYRSDIASLFPNYANSNGAVGYFYLDTRKYPDGVHTIQWTAADNAGNIDGIGSRYFTVNNFYGVSASAATSLLPGLGRYTGQIPGRTRHTIQELAIMPEEKGLNELVIKELDRVEIKLGENHGEILGYLLCSNELKKLPIGSTLDAKTGTFYWSPGPGFLGRYSLVFVLTNPDGQSYKKSIEIEIVPRFNGLWLTD
jgi:Leucine-rich repeat (LRR) protein